MNWDQIAGQWKQLEGQAKSKWAKLTDDDMKSLAGKKDALVGKIQQRYGIAKEEAEKQVSEWTAKLSAAAQQEDLRRNYAKHGEHTGRNCSPCCCALSAPGAAALNQLKHDHEQRQQEKHVNEPSHGVRADQSQKPQDEKNDADCPKHVESLRAKTLPSSHLLPVMRATFMPVIRL